MSAFDPVQYFAARKRRVDPTKAIPGIRAPDQTMPTLGYEFDPAAQIVGGFETGVKNMEANTNYFKAMIDSMTGSEKAMRDSIHEAGIAQQNASARSYVESAAAFEQMISENGTFEDFMNAALGFTGEIGPSALATISAALIGTGVAALTAPASVPAAIGAAGTAALAKKTAEGVTVRLAKQGITKKMVTESIEAATKRQALTANQRTVMDAVYKNFQAQMYKRRLTRGGLTGAFGQEYTQMSGTIFGNFAEQGMTDPVNALMSSALGVPSAGIGVFTEKLVFDAVTDVFNKSGGRSLLTKAGANAKSTVGRDALRTAAIATGAESFAETAQTAIEVGQKFAIDDEYTAQQAKLELQMSAFAGAAGGLGVGGGAAIASAVPAKAQEYLDRIQQKEALERMYREKYGTPGQVQKEPATWLRGQMDEMLKTGNGKNSVFIDINSYDQWAQIAPDYELQFANGTLTGYEFGVDNLGLGGIFISTEKDNVQSFKQSIELNTPSTKLIDDVLVGMLKYPRGRLDSDQYVVEVRNKDGVPVHYHQSSALNEDGKNHIEQAKKLFNNSNEYTYELVGAEDHLNSRQEAITPDSIVGDVNFIQDDDSFVDIFSELNNFQTIEELAPVKTKPVEGDPSSFIVFKQRGKGEQQGWAPPNPAFNKTATDERPTPLIIDEARSIHEPAFRPEFDRNIAEGNYSNALLRKFVEYNDTNYNPKRIYRIEQNPFQDDQQYIIQPYDIEPELRRNLDDLNYDLRRALRKAKERVTTLAKEPGVVPQENQNNFYVEVQNVLGKKTTTAPQPINMPSLINAYRRTLLRAGLLEDTTSAKDLQGYRKQLADTFTTVVGSLADSDNIKIYYSNDKGLTLRNPLDADTMAEIVDNAVIYTEGENNFTYNNLLGAAQSPPIRPMSETTRDASIAFDFKEKAESLANRINDQKAKIEERKKNPIKAPFKDKTTGELVTQEKIITKMEASLKKLEDDLAKTRTELEEENVDAPPRSRLGEQTQTVREAELTPEEQRLRARVGPRTAEEQAQQPQYKDELKERSITKLVAMQDEADWDAEFKSHQKQPLQNVRVPIKRKKVTTNNPVELSSNFIDTFGVNRGIVERLVKDAQQKLQLKKPIKVFTTREDIDVGDIEGAEDINRSINTMKQKILDKQELKGVNIPFRDFDVIILKSTLNPDLDIQGLMFKRLGHEIGHSFLRTELMQTLGVPAQRAILIKKFQRDRDANPNISQYQGKNGMEEWASDKIGSILFDKNRGIVFQASDLGDSILNRIATRLVAFETSTRTGMAGQQSRFAYSESFAEYVNGVLDAAKQPFAEGNNVRDVADLDYMDQAHIEDLIDTVFPAGTGEKGVKKIVNAADKIIKNGKLPKWFKKLFYDAHSFVGTLGKDQGTGKKIGDMLHTESGTQGTVGAINESNRKTNEYINKLVTVLRGENDQVDPLTGTTRGFTDAEKAIFKEAADESKQASELSPKARAVREFLFNLYDEFELGKYGIKRRPNFFPRIIAVVDIANDSKLRERLSEMIQEKTKVSKAFADKKVEQMIKNNETTPDIQGEDKYDIGMDKNRSELFEVFNTVELIDEGLALPAEVAILEYIRQAARKSEYAKRGGAKQMNAYIEQLPEEERPLADEAVNAMLGKIDPIKNDIWRLVTNGGLLVNVFTLLGMAVFASLPDAAGPILRSREFDRKTIAKNLYQALGQKEGARLAKSIGANGADAAAYTILYAGEMDALDRIPRMLSMGFFRYTQLERWTVFTRKFAAGMGRDFLIKHAKQVKEGYEGDQETLLSARYLKDLDVTADQVLAGLTPGNTKGLDAHPEVKTALGRFVDEAIVRPNAAERPMWASDPHWAIVWQLKSFYYAYGKNIIGGLLREGKARYGEQETARSAVEPLLFGAALLLPLTMLGWDLRERFKIGLSWLLPGISPNDPGVNYRASRDMSTSEYWFEVLERSGIFGPLALTIPIFMEDKRYGNPFFIPILGPSAEKGWDLITGDFDGFDYLPGYSQLDTRNFGR